MSTLAKTVAQAIPGVWDNIAPDIGSIDETVLLYLSEGIGNSIPATDVVELCVDADRLHTFGFEDAYKASKKMLVDMDWSEFCKAVAAELPYSRYEV